MRQVTAAEIRTLTRPGRFRVAPTLYALIDSAGRRRWVQRISINGRQADLGLGSIDLIPLRDARQRAADNRRIVYDGGDPRRKRTSAPTFREAARQTLEANRAAWKHERTAGSWLKRLERYVYPTIGARAVNAITRAEVLAVLVPVYRKRPELGRRLRQAVRQVFAWAQAHGHTDDNPAGESIAAALPKAPTVKTHHRTLPYREAGRVLRAVDASSASAAVKLIVHFLMLTAARSGEARLATWGEVDLEAATWTIPAARMKASRPHRVPLSRAALAVLREARKLSDGALIFPSPRGRALSGSALVAAISRAGVDLAPHGMRAMFRTWCAENSDAPREVCEAALAHVERSQTVAAYQHSDYFARRATLMEAWASFVLP